MTDSTADSDAQLTAITRAVPPLYVGVDVGGTGIKLGIVDDQGQTLAYRRIATLAERGPEDAVARIAEAVEQLLAGVGALGAQVRAIGLGTPGTMDIPAGMLVDPPNLPRWAHFPIRDRLAEATGYPVVFSNDAAAAAFGEFWLGSGKEYPSIVLLTLGTGLGGGIIIDGRSLDGENSHGSECGHIIIDSSPAARLCSCGQRGHLEAYASATAVIKRTVEALGDHPDSAVAQRVAGGEDVTPLLVAEVAEQGDAFARRIVLETADYLTIGVVTLLHVIDPGAVILGGAMTFGGNDSPLGREFLERVRSSVRRKTFPVIAERTTIDFATLGNRAGYLGAAGIARESLARQRP